MSEESTESTLESNVSEECEEGTEEENLESEVEETAEEKEGSAEDKNGKNEERKDRKDRKYDRDNCEYSSETDEISDTYDMQAEDTAPDAPKGNPDMDPLLEEHWRRLGRGAGTPNWASSRAPEEKETSSPYRKLLQQRIRGKTERPTKVYYRITIMTNGVSRQGYFASDYKYN